MDSSNSPSGSGASLIAPGLTDISQTAFYALTWIFFALCTIAFLARIYVRFVCFGRLLLEDYLMIIALAMHNVEAVLIQIYAGHAFDMEAVLRGDLSRLTPDFMPNSGKAFVVDGVCATLSMVGVLIIKLNFLLFFRRISVKTGKRFIVAWWAVLAFTVIAAAVQIGILEYRCFYNPIEYIFYSGNCTNGKALRRTRFTAIFSAVQDAVSDLLIIGFPVSILWRSGIEMQKKLVLTFVFCLAFFTVAITIVRGSVFTKVWSEEDQGELVPQPSLTFMWFWFYTEFSVSIIIACLVSFRTLFVNHDRKTRNRIQEQQRREAFLRSKAHRGFQNRVLRLHNSVLNTCSDLEGVDLVESRAETLAMDVPSGLMTVDFSDDTNWSRTIVTTDKTNSTDKAVSARLSVSMQSLLRAHTKK